MWRLGSFPQSISAAGSLAYTAEAPRWFNARELASHQPRGSIARSDVRTVSRSRHESTRSEERDGILFRCYLAARPEDPANSSAPFQKPPRRRIQKTDSRVAGSIRRPSPKILVFFFFFFFPFRPFTLFERIEGYKRSCGNEPAVSSSVRGARVNPKVITRFGPRAAPERRSKKRSPGPSGRVWSEQTQCKYRRRCPRRL